MKSIEFLKLWSRKGPWVLTAIGVDRKTIWTETFYPESEEALKKFIKKHNFRDNIYFHVNPVMHDLQTKARREDIKEVAWLHVDIDPRPEQPLETEQERALKLLKEYQPPPTCIIFSGGGYQGFWKLETPIPINGDLAEAKKAGHYNLQLELDLGGDNCHNVDRIMRLPGTENMPDAKKRAKGREPTEAYMAEIHTNRVYPISTFTAAPVIQVTTELFSEKMPLPTKVNRLKCVDDLDEYGEIADWCKVVIVQGNDPLDSAKYASRSEALFAVLCELVRKGIPDEIIYTVITDEDFKISESVLDKGGAVHSYAVRQIQQAKDRAISPHLAKMNLKHAVIESIGGKCRIVGEVWDPGLSRHKIDLQSFSDFYNRYNNVQVQVGENEDGVPKLKPLGLWWASHPNRRQYESMVFAPGKQVDGAYNLWKGFSVRAHAGDCSLYVNHIKDNICNGDAALFNYVWQWMARCVQKPDRPGETAIVMRGKQGTGKSFFVKTFGALWGRHFLQVSNAKHLVGQFNKHLRDCVVLFGDEAFFAGDRANTGTLKTLVTEQQLVVELKGIDAEPMPNYLHILMASNSDWVVPANVDERRFCVIDVAENEMQNSDYFAKIKHQMDNGGMEALLYELQNHHLNGFNVRQFPKTEALMDQKLLSLTAEQEWWFCKLSDGRLTKNHRKWTGSVQKDLLIEDYLSYTQSIGVTRRATATQLGKFLKKVCPTSFPIVRQRQVNEPYRNEDGEEMIDLTRKYFWEFPTLDACREHFDKNYGGPYDWIEPIPIAQEQQGAF